MTDDQTATINAVILFLMTHAIPGSPPIMDKDAWLMSEFLCAVFHDGMGFEEARQFSLMLGES